MMTDYADIINMPHHVSAKRPQMSMADRAAQFSPFAALTGYDAAIKETGRLTDEKIELEEDALLALDEKLRQIVDSPENCENVDITYFKADATKDGGAYITATGRIKKLDDYQRLIVLDDGKVIPMDDVLSIEERIEE